MKKYIPLFLALSLCMASCSNGTNHEHKNSATELGIQLKDGKKWKVNPEMVPHIEEGEKLLKSYTSASEEDHMLLAEKLKAQNNALIQSCTMKGESHDELHKWLHPHLALVNQLAKAENSNEAEALIHQLNDSFSAYHQYFD